MRDFFSATKISERLYTIRESYCDQDGFTLGLVIGDREAAVIDSGLGAVDGLRRFVETLTDKPLICLVTHGHPDHAGGAILFDKSYMSRLDDPELAWGLTRERRLGDLKDFSRNDAAVEAYAAGHCVDCTGYTYEELTDGQIFDLGGVKLEALAMPGHTKGSYIFVNHEEEYIFTGDAVSETLMVTSYERSAMEVRKYIHFSVVGPLIEASGDLLGVHDIDEGVRINLMYFSRDGFDLILSDHGVEHIALFLPIAADSLEEGCVVVGFLADFLVDLLWFGGDD